MTWPVEYQHASLDFERFMVSARDAAALATTNMAWTTVQGVLLVFRRRLTVNQAIEFANVLPPLLRALFTGSWSPGAAPVAFESRDALTAEVRALRPQHNFSPPNAIEAVALALRASVDQAALDRVLSKCHRPAYWSQLMIGELEPGVDRRIGAGA